MLLVITSLISFVFLLKGKIVQAKSKEFIPRVSLDLAGADEVYIDLDGEWLFFQERLLDQEQLTTISVEDGERVQLPTNFASLTGKKNSFGTFVIEVDLPEQLVGESIAIHIPYQYSAYALFVEDQLIASNGTVGQDSESHRAEMAPKTGYFIPETSQVQLIMQVSSFNHIRGGFENSIFIGKTADINQKTNANMISSIFLLYSFISKYGLGLGN